MITTPLSTTTVFSAPNLEVAAAMFAKIPHKAYLKPVSHGYVNVVIVPILDPSEIDRLSLEFSKLTDAYHKTL